MRARKSRDKRLGSLQFLQVCGDASEYMQVASGEYVENRQNKTGRYKRIIRGSQSVISFGERLANAKSFSLPLLYFTYHILDISLARAKLIRGLFPLSSRQRAAQEGSGASEI